MVPVEVEIEKSEGGPRNVLEQRRGRQLGYIMRNTQCDMPSSAVVIYARPRESLGSPQREGRVHVRLGLRVASSTVPPLLEGGRRSCGARGGVEEQKR